MEVNHVPLMAGISYNLANHDIISFATGEPADYRFVINESIEYWLSKKRPWTTLKVKQVSELECSAVRRTFKFCLLNGRLLTNTVDK